MEVDKRIEWEDLPTETEAITLLDDDCSIEAVLEPSDIQRIYQHAAFCLRAKHSIHKAPGFFYPYTGSFKTFKKQLAYWWKERKLMPIPCAATGPLILHYRCAWPCTIGLAEKYPEIEILRRKLSDRQLGLPETARNKWVHTNIVQLSFEVIRIDGKRGLRLRYATRLSKIRIASFQRVDFSCLLQGNI